MNCLHKLAVAPAAVCAALLLSGCASLSGDGGFGAAAAVSEQRTGLPASVAGRLPRDDDDARALAAVIDEKLARPLSADDAVHIALLNNRGLRASYWSLGIAEADLVQAGRLRNPVLDFKRSHGGGDVSIERTLTFNLLGLVTAPAASRIEGRRYEQAKLLASGAALKLAADTRRAWVDAVAAIESARYARQVDDSAQASAELGERMRRAGNWSALDVAREEAYHAQTTADAARARRAVLAARERLARLMGLDAMTGDQRGGGQRGGKPGAGEQGAGVHDHEAHGADKPGEGGHDDSGYDGAASFRLPERLPDLPAAPRELADVERTAIAERLDIRAARLDTEQTAATLGLTRATRFINVLDLGAVRNSDAGQSIRGYELSLEIPLFDWGSARTARAEAVYMQSVNLLAQSVAEARGEARESYADYHAAYQLARHYRDQVVPLRKRISDQTLLRYNGMLVSVFELLADAREQAAAVGGYIGALKDYWTAQANLEAALGGRLPTQPGTQQGVQP